MKVLIADDEIAVKEAIEILLDQNICKIDMFLYACNGLKALELLESEHPDIIFCDMQMPMLAGDELLKEVVKREIKVQVIAVSGYSDFQYMKAAMLASGVDYILKPIDPDELNNAYKKAVNNIQKLKRQEEIERHFLGESEYISDEKFSIEKVYSYLRSHYKKDVTIGELADYFCQSQQNISKKFKEFYGITIVTALTNIRMEQAKLLLRHSNMTVSQIAEQTGYLDESYFSKVFKKEIGQSPKHFRQGIMDESKTQ